VGTVIYFRVRKKKKVIEAEKELLDEIEDSYNYDDVDIEYEKEEQTAENNQIETLEEESDKDEIH
jgi:hypothetical protein